MIQPATASAIRALAARDVSDASPSFDPDASIAPPDVLAMLADLAASIQSRFVPAAWWWFDDDGQIAGLCSITRPPSQGDVDIGYGVARGHHGRGIATRAIAATVRWARSDPRVLRLTAETSVDNLASQRVLQRNGFAVVGRRLDAEDGEVLCWALPT